MRRLESMLRGGGFSRHRWPLKRPTRYLVATSFIALGLILSGCHAAPGTATSKPTTMIAGPMQMSVTAQPAPSDNPRDPRPQLNAMVHLDIYLLGLPAGSVSANREFWRRADEQAVGAANADRLIRNGIRCGVVPRQQGAYFSQFFDHLPHPPARRSIVDSMHMDSVQVELQKKFDHEDLFFFNSAGELEGRSYDKATNQWALTFGPAARDPAAIHLTLCPQVSSEKSLLRLTPLSQEYETTASSVDRIYDLGLSLDLPVDSFMIISPSIDASRKTSVGGRFLMQEEKTTKLEQVIVIVPTYIRLDGKPMVVRERLIK